MNSLIPIYNSRCRVIFCHNCKHGWCTNAKRRFTKCPKCKEMTIVR